ncbi:MAG: acyltransferase [Alphaproteobacteria bacterium]|nr:acyltransferase [Alphaproteobacteria bacterium]
MRKFYLTRFWGMDIDSTADFSLSARFDRTNPRGVHVGPESFVAFGAVVLSHDMTRRLSTHTRIGRRCFIGARSIVLPGVTIGDESIVGAGSVVTRDVPPNSIVVGNPARVVRTGIRLGPRGYILKEGEIA